MDCSQGISMTQNLAIVKTSFMVAAVEMPTISRQLKNAERNVPNKA